MIQKNGLSVAYVTALEMKKTMQIRLRNQRKHYEYELRKIRQQTAQEIFKEIDFLIENKECIYKLSDKDYNNIKQKYLGGKN